MNVLYSASLLMSFVFSVYAQGGKSPGSGGMAGSFIPMMVVMFIVIYFFMIRPEQRKQKDKKNMMENLKKGDKILTIGGIYGTVGNIKDDTVMVRIGDNTTVKFAKSAISSVITNKEESRENKNNEGKK